MQNKTNSRIQHSGFNEPPEPYNKDKGYRKTGVEFEFTGIEMAESADLIQGLYGGKISEISTYEMEVADTELGTFRIELDAKLFQDKKYEEYLNKIGVNISGYKNLDKLEERLRAMASTLVPFEIISDPIPLPDLHRLEELITEMRKLKAEGTGSSIFNAFGLHLNPEIPDPDPRTLLNILRAFVLLDPWIRKNADTDISRRITPFINEFKKPYIQKILQEDYRPDVKELIRDYMEAGNTRNRPLDMLPLFAWLDENLVDELSEDERISSRPAFHYRLPDFLIDDPDWTLALEWNRWVLVEKLAEDEDTLMRYAKSFLKMDRDHIFGNESKWIELLNRWVIRNG